MRTAPVLAAPVLAMLLLVATTLAGCTAPPPSPTIPATDHNGANPGRPLVLVDTSVGPLLLELFSDKTPGTVNHFLNLTRSGFYDGLRFHRTIGPAKAPPDGFLVQAGDPLSRNQSSRDRWGSGSFGPQIPDEYPRDGAGNLLLRFDAPGMVALGTRGPNTGTSHFFITLAPAPHLDGAAPIFGRVVAGMDALHALGSAPTDAADRPLADLLIHRAVIAGSLPQNISITDSTFPSVQSAAAGNDSIVWLNTSLGELRVRLFLDAAPLTAGNFLSLVRQGFYDGTLFHRAFGANATSPPKGVQGGDPLTRNQSARDRWGTGGPGYTIPAEFLRSPDGSLVLRHDRAGLVSMAANDAGTVGSQFVISLAPTPELDGQAPVFGEVVEGMETVQRIVGAPADDRGVFLPMIPIWKAAVVS